MSILDELHELHKQGLPPAQCPYCGEYQIPRHLWKHKYFAKFKRQAELEEIEADPKKLGEAFADDLLADIGKKVKEKLEEKKDTESSKTP